MTATMNAPMIEHNDIFRFEGLALTPTPGGLTRPAGTLPDMDPTAIGDVLVKVVAVTWTGDLHAIRGHRAPNGDLIFPEETPENITLVPIATAVALIEQGIWEHHRY